MADYIRLEVTGMEQTIRNLEELPVEVQRNVVKPAVRAAALPIKRQATKNIKAFTTKRTGNLAKSMTKREQTKRGAFIITIGPSQRLGGRHGHLVEEGTRERFRKGRYGKGAPTGRMPALHPVRKAYTARAHESVDVFERKLVEGVEREAEKLGRRCRG